jgi:hypothetical protein
MEELETEVAGKSIPKEVLEKTKEVIENSCKLKMQSKFMRTYEKTTFILRHGFSSAI